MQGGSFPSPASFSLLPRSLALGGEAWGRLDAGLDTHHVMFTVSPTREGCVSRALTRGT